MGRRVVIQRRRLFYKPDGFYQIDAKEAIDFLLPRHYKGDNNEDYSLGFVYTPEVVED